MCSYYRLKLVGGLVICKIWCVSYCLCLAGIELIFLWGGVVFVQVVSGVVCVVLYFIGFFIWFGLWCRLRCS